MQKPARSKGASSYFEHIDNPGGMDSPLLSAFTWKKWKMAEWLLKNGANPDSKDKNRNTALLHSVRRKYDPKYIKLLLRFGADPDLANEKGETPRKLASKYRDKTILSLFV